MLTFNRRNGPGAGRCIGSDVPRCEVDKAEKLQKENMLERHLASGRLVAARNNTMATVAVVLFCTLRHVLHVDPCSVKTNYHGAHA